MFIDTRNWTRPVAVLLTTFYLGASYEAYLPRHQAEENGPTHCADKTCDVNKGSRVHSHASLSTPRHLNCPFCHLAKSLVTAAACGVSVIAPAPAAVGSAKGAADAKSVLDIQVVCLRGPPYIA